MAGEINFSGLVSSMDTSAIIDSQVEARSMRLNRLKDDQEKHELKRMAFEQASTDLLGLREELLSMRLESTYGEREAVSANEAAVTASANLFAQKTSHSIDIHQIARGAQAISDNTRAQVSTLNVDNSSRIKAISSKYDGQLEAVHDLAFDSITGVDSAGATMAYALGHNSISLENKPSMLKVRGTAIEGTAAGTFGGSITAGSTMDLSVNGTSVQITFDQNFSAANTLNSLAAYIDQAANEALNTANGTTDERYIAVGSSLDSMDTSSAGGTDGLVFYNTQPATSAEEQIGFGTGTAATALGLASGTSSSRSMTIDLYATSQATTTAAADIEIAYADLYQNRIGSATEGVMGNLENDMNFTYKDPAEETPEGRVRILTSSRLNMSENIYARIDGGAVDLDGAATQLDTSALISASGMANFDWEALKGEFTINDVEIDIFKEDEDGNRPALAMDNVLGAINGSGAGVTATYDDIENRIVLTANKLPNELGENQRVVVGDQNDSSEFLSMMNLTIASGADSTSGQLRQGFDTSATGLSFSTGIFTINGVSIYANAEEDSIDSIIEKINNSGAGVRAYYDDSQDRFGLIGDLDDSGGVGATNDSRITIGSANDTSNFLGLMKVTDTISGGTTTPTEIGEAGQDAIFTYDNQTYTRATNEVSGMPGGLDMTLRGTTDGPTTLSVEGDPDKTVETIAGFIAKYNKSMDYINAQRLNEDERKYLEPLNDEQMNSMGLNEYEEYMENYQQFNMSETMRRSTEINSLAMTLRNTMSSRYSEASSQIQSLADMGIELAGQDNYAVLMKGMLVMDSTDAEEIEEELRKNSTFMNAVKDNERDVYNLFALETGPDEDQPYGVARVLEEVIDSYVMTDGLIKNKIKANGLFDTQARRYAQDIEREQERLDSYENNLKRRFAAMEQRMAELQSQTSALDGLPANS